MTDTTPIRTRSWLFTPATHPERFGKASAAGADVAILDLEDAVASQDKGRARSTALDYLAGASAEGSMRALRINGRPPADSRPSADRGGQGRKVDRPDRKRARPCGRGGNRDSHAAAIRLDAGRRRHGR